MTNSDRMALIKKYLREIEGAAQEIKDQAHGDRHLIEISEALHLDTLAILDLVERLEVKDDGQ